MAGGQVVEVFKGRGDPSTTTSYRDVLVCDADVKSFLSSCRHKMKDHLQHVVPECQFGGGMNFGATSSAHLIARAHVDHALLSGLCCIQFFLDVKTAFASML
eukprot:4948827-Karenia_brevis.AAC.1